MSPYATVTRWTEYRFPRVSGDEPDTGLDLYNWVTFSPRERG